MANVVNALDATTNWTTTTHMTLLADTADKQEGTASLSNTITASAAANEQWYYNYGGATNWGTNNGNTADRIGFWLKSSVNTASGAFSWQDSNLANLGTPLDTLAIPALTANTWTYSSVTLGASRASQLSYGFRNTSDVGAATLKVDSISKIFDAADAVTGWSSDGGITRSVLTTAGNFMEGTGAARCTYAASAGIGTSGDCFDNEGGIITLGPGTTVTFWIRPSVALAAGDFAFVDDNSSNLASVLDTINLPAISANTWTYVTLTAPNSGTARSYGFRQQVDKGAFTLDIDAIGKQLDAGNSTTGWATSAGTVQTLSTDTTVFHENSASLKNIIGATAAAGDQWYETFGSAQNWSAYTTVGFWIRSTVPTTAGQLKFEYSSASDLTSPIASINIGALSANTWTFQKLALSGTRTSVSSYGIQYATDIGAATIYLDDVLIGPGSPTFPGGVAINARILSLANTQTATITYGSGGGTSGATAPSTPGVYTFTTQSRASDAGTLTSVLTSPTITVTPQATRFVIVDPTDGTVDAPIVVTVQATDDLGNIATDYQNDVTLVASGSATGEGLVNIINGVGTKALSNTVVETVELSLSDTSSTGLNVASTQNVVFASGPPSQFTLNDPGNISAGNRAEYIVTRKDQSGNAVTTGSTTVYFSGNSTGSNKAFYNVASGGSPVTSITINDGASTASIWYYDDLAGSWTVTASDNASSPDGAIGIDDANDAITVAGGAVAQFVLTNPGNTTAGTRLGYSVSRQDIYGNAITTGSNTVYLYSNSTGANKAFYDAASGGSVITSLVIGDSTSTGTFWSYDELAGAWTITASDNASTPDGATGIIDATDTVTISPGATSVFLLNDPGNVSAGTRLGYLISRQDAYGNNVTSGSNTVYLYSNSTGVNKAFYAAESGGSPITSVSIVNGTSTATAWYYDEQVGTWTITASDNASAPDGTTGIDDATDTVNITPAGTSEFLLSDPGNISAGSRAGYLVTRKDPFGNFVTSSEETVYLYSNSSGSAAEFYTTASGNVTSTAFTIPVGTSTLMVWYEDQLAGTWTITASDNASAPDGTTGIDDATDSITVSAGAFAQVTLDDPGNMTAGTRLGYLVSRQDAYGNSVLTGSNTVYLYSNSTGANKAFHSASTGGSTITSVLIGDGTSTASAWYYDDLVGTWTITASDNASAPDGATGVIDDTDAVTVNPGMTSELFLTNPGNMTAGSRLGYLATRKDIFGNLVTNVSETFYLYSNSTGVNKAFYNAASGGSAFTSLAIGNGTSTASFWYYDELAGNWTITISDDFTSPDGAVGVIDATDAVIVTGGSTSQFAITDPGGMVAGARLGYAVTRQDSFGNMVTTGSDTLYLFSNSTGANKAFYNAESGGVTISSATIGSGTSTANIWYYDDLVGNWSIVASDNASGGDGAAGIADAVDSVAVTASSTALFLISDPGDMSVGTRLGYTITRKDAFSNLVTSGSDTVYLYTNSSGGNAKFYDANSGGAIITSVTIANTQSTGNAWYFDDAAGNWIVTASDNASAADGAAGIDDAADAVAVSAAPIVADRFVIIDPTDGTVDAPITVTVRAVDGSGSIDSTIQQDVRLYVSGSATGGGVVDIINGVGTRAVSDTLAETVTLTLSDTEGTGLNVSSTQNVAFAPGAVSQLTFTDVSTITAGSRAAYTVTRKDQYGNQVTNGNTDITLTTNSTGSSARFFDSAVDGLAITSHIISNGNSTADVWYYDEHAGSWTVTATTTGATNATDVLTVSPGATAKFTLSDPGVMTVDSRLGYTVTRKDAYDNLVILNADTAYLFTNSTGTTAAFFPTSVGGSSISSITVPNNQSSANFWYYDEVEGTWTITASDNSSAPDGATNIDDGTDAVTVNPAAQTATRFAIQAASTATVGTPVTITIRAEDNSGNLATAYQNDVTLVLSGTATGGGLVDVVNGIGTSIVNASTSQSVNLTLSDTQSTGLNVSAVHVLTFSDAPPTGGLIGGGSQDVIVNLPTVSAPTAPFTLTGRAYPAGKVRFSESQGSSLVTVKEETITDPEGAFVFNLTGDISGKTYGIRVSDQQGRLSPVSFVTIPEDTETPISRTVIVPPTISLQRSTVTKGAAARVTGNATPGSTAEVSVDGRIVNVQAPVSDKGIYTVLVPTFNLALGNHTVRIRETTNDARVSDYSLQKSFTVSRLFNTRTDLNGDGRVDLLDWNIFNAKWRSTNPALRKDIDLNGDGKTDIADFAIIIQALRKP